MSYIANPYFRISDFPRLLPASVFNILTDFVTIFRGKVVGFSCEQNYEFQAWVTNSMLNFWKDAKRRTLWADREKWRKWLTPLLS